MFVGDGHAELARDELGAEVVRMAAQRGASRPVPLEERPKIGDEAIMTRHELVELPASGDVLIFEQLRLARRRRPEHRRCYFVVDGRELGAVAREEARDRRKPVGERRRPRRLQHDIRVLVA